MIGSTAVSRSLLTILIVLILFYCTESEAKSLSDSPQGHFAARFEVLILGVAQDAGYPQINCYQAHCMPAWKDPEKGRMATSFALLDHQQRQYFLFEATPDIKQQLYQVYRHTGGYKLTGIFVTHAHIGHYTGLMHFGREAQGARALPVYVMPRMATFLTKNGPWSQLVELKNIQLKPLASNQLVNLADGLSVRPFVVPHRDEFSETVGFEIMTKHKRLLFIPDIDKWSRWEKDIRQIIKRVDYALVDATFYAASEIKNRDMREIPHPFVVESMKLFSELQTAQKHKIFFIHFNHTNPLLIENSLQQKQLQKAGYHFVQEGMKFKL